MNVLGILVNIFMFPVAVIMAIFGEDPDTFRFYIGLLLIVAYCVLLGIAGAIFFGFLILSGLHMIGVMLLEW